MTTHKPAKRRKPGERVYPEPKPKLRLLKPQSECSTPELTAEMTQAVKAALCRLVGKRKGGGDGDPPKAA